jgi:hypothetical protein
MVARIGAVTGWLTLASVLLFSVIGPQIIAGQRVSGVLEPAAIQAYYRHAALAPFSAAGFVIILFLLPFVLALRQSLASNERARFFSTLGLLFAIAAVPLYLASNTLQATLVAIAAGGGDIVPMFRLWDVLYNGAAYVLEAGYAAAFAIAMRDTPEFPRWMPVYGLVVALLQLVNASALFTGIPDMVTLVGNLAFMGWFIGASIGLSRLARAVRATSTLGSQQGI